MPPTRLAASASFAGKLASARGKLAPHKTAAGKMATAERPMSLRKSFQGPAVELRLPGQYGSESASMNAPQAIAAQSASWLAPSQNRGLFFILVVAETAPLPNPSPARKTPRMMENV